MKSPLWRKGLLGVLMFFVLTVACAADGKNLDDLVSQRTARLYLEGQVLGDMILGARARLDFIYVDRPLFEAVKRNPEAPEWLQWNVNYLGSEKVGKDALFILSFETFKPWTFKPDMISVNGRPVTEDDIVTKKDYVPVGDLPSGYKGTLAFAVSGEYIKPGGKIIFSCQGESVTWTVPVK